jgi:hypothetical protein
MGHGLRCLPAAKQPPAAAVGKMQAAQARRLCVSLRYACPSSRPHACYQAIRRGSTGSAVAAPAQAQSTWPPSNAKPRRGAARLVAAASLSVASSNPGQPAAEPAAEDSSARVGVSELWQLLEQDRGRLVTCIAFTALSVATAVLIAPNLGNVVDIISRATAATPEELLRAVGRLGAVYIISNVSLTVQVSLYACRLRCSCRLLNCW